MHMLRARGGWLLGRPFLLVLLLLALLYSPRPMSLHVVCRMLVSAQTLFFAAKCFVLNGMHMLRARGGRLLGRIFLLVLLLLALLYASARAWCVEMRAAVWCADPAEDAQRRSGVADQLLSMRRVCHP